ncbi:hypothetical protein [Shouchella clausii]|uniref:hypothetical protein n=1 Tax=Shouchella clausii TaxID=79880 RepID=UPI001C731111|nr:hypothetical protein [Shouchella clausii]MBX0320310.1 hypothetical protein [Shouchella clausii]
MTSSRERQIKQVANELRYIIDNPFKMAESLVELGRATDPNWWVWHDRLEETCYRAANRS